MWAKSQGRAFLDAICMTWDITIKTSSQSKRIILAIRQTSINTMKTFIVLAVVIVAGTLDHSVSQ